MQIGDRMMPIMAANNISTPYLGALVQSKPSSSTCSWYSMALGITRLTGHARWAPPFYGWEL